MASSKGGEVNCCNEDHEHDKTLESKLASVAVELLDEDDEYESLPPSASILVQGMAGSIAGVVEHTCFFPVDVVKTRLHRIRPEPGANYTGAIHGLRTIVAKEGVRGLFNGFGVTALGAGPAHAMYFACYEQAKVAFGASEGPARNPGGVAAAAVVATMAHLAVSLLLLLSLYEKAAAGNCEPQTKYEGLSLMQRSREKSAEKLMGLKLVTVFSTDSSHTLIGRHWHFFIRGDVLAFLADL